MKLIPAILLGLFTQGVTAQSNTETFTTAGTSTWTVPDGVTQITVQAWGAGGGGGFARENRYAAGGGGGGGGYSHQVISVTPGQIIDYSVGVGGVGGSRNGSINSSNGGATEFGTFVSADGGERGIDATNYWSGFGGEGGLGTIFRGGTGGTGYYYGGGGGSSAGIALNGNNGTDGNGGVAVEGGGAGGNGGYNLDGAPGGGPGGGGAGGNRNNNNRAGGAGANGQIRITYTPADYLAIFNTMDIGPKIWEEGETRTVTVTVTNYGRETWTDASPDINIGVKWNGDPDYMVRVDAGGLNPRESATYSFSVTAPATPGINNLSFDIVNELNCWFGNNNGSCGPGNTVFRSEELVIVPSIDKYYSYRSGNWNDPTTWTHDPSGTTQVCETVPGEYSEVYILSGREVSLSANVTAENLNVSIASGGVLNMKNLEFTNTLLYLRGEGTLKLASTNFPSVTNNLFVETGGGTTEYNNTSAFVFPAAQTQYNNLTLNAPGITGSMMSNLVLNGNLNVKAGVFRINNNSSTNKYALTINGDVLVNIGASFTVGTGKTNVDLDTKINVITGGTAPFLDYYTQFHTVILKGDFTNNGTVRLTNLDYPIFDAFPSAAGKTGAATVYFQGASNNMLTCNGTTDFYNLVLDKGLDQTYKLTVYSTAYNKFRLFGANGSGGDTNGATNENPNLKKALWIRTGTLELTGLTIIPSLSEGSNYSTSPNSDFYIPANGALLLNGPDVIVLSTADDYREINVAYGVSGGTGAVNGVNKSLAASSFSVYGNFQVKDGYFSTRESGGLIFWDFASGQINISGGYVDAKQLRAAGGYSGLASYQQTGGTVALRGRYQRVPAQYISATDLRANTLATINTTLALGGLDGNMGTFNLNAPANVFAMSGGTIQVYDVSGGTNDYAIDIFASANNINVSGGTIELLPLTGNDKFIVRSNAPFGNMIINRAGGTSEVQLGTGYPLTVLKDFNISAGYFRTNNQDVTIGGHFTVDTNGTYHSGTNTTLFNGTNGQTFTINGTINNGANGLNNLSINKPSGILALDGTQTDLTVRGALALTKGTLDDGGKTISVAGNVTNSGIHTGTGKIELKSTNTQTIGGDGNGIFENLTLNNTNGAAAPVSLTANTTVNGELAFASNKHLNIATYNLKMNTDASFSSADANSYIQTAGNAGDGGLTLTYNSIDARAFPVGVDAYTPATLGFTSAPTTYGTITVVPVNYEHTVTTIKNISLKYFWRVKSDGITGYDGKVIHQFIYNQGDVSGTEANYVPAMYNASNYTWSYGATGDVNKTTNTISDWTASTSFLNGDYTAGIATAFGTPAKFYSRQTGRWNLNTTWSTTGHTGGTAPRIPVEGDVVIIGAGHTVSLQRWNNTANIDDQNCASLQIEAGGTLDVTYNPASNFGMVLSHPNGNGLIRVSTRYNSGSTFEFPQGDYTDFNANLGTTELYTINENSNTTYWLPNNIDNYGNLIISPLGGSNIIFGNTDVTIYGDLTTQGQNSQSWFLPTWDSNYPTAPTARQAKTITINGNFDLQGGALIYYGNNNLAQDFVINGNLIVGESSGIMIYDRANNQNIHIGGNFINNAAFGTGVNAYRGCNFTNIPLVFFGETNTSITNTTGTPSTTLGKVTINKGTSQSTKLTINIGGALTTPVDNWLTLENGTLEYKRVNPNSDFTITTTSQFTIPATAGLYIDYAQNSGNRNILIANNNSNTNDLYLNGKLTVVNGNVYVGATNAPGYNNDIEYSGGGASAIEVQGGKLVVNGQIRRNPATTSGILSYTQSGGQVTINGNNANTTNAKLEVLNTGSKFNMSGGTLTLVRGGGGNAYGDLYLRPASSSVTGGGIIFANELSAAAQTYQLDATAALNNVTVTGYSSGDATVKQLISPLTLKGNLVLSNANSVFDANSEFNIGLTIKGDFENNGTYNHYNNLTVFNGGEQELLGTSITSFHDLKVNPVTSLTFSKDVTVENDLELASGTLILGNNLVTLNGNLVNNATYTSGDAVGGVLLTGGSEQHQISGSGTFSRMELNDSNGARLLNNISLNKNLLLSAGVFNINQYLLSLGQNANIEGSDFGPSKMISSDGVFSNLGIQKLFPTIATETIFTYPMGIANKYTPAVLTIDSNTTAGYIRVNTVNDKHPSAKSPYRVLKYFWEVESTGVTGFNGELEFHYDEDDVQQISTDESNYVAARLLTPTTSWSKAAAGSLTDNVEEGNNIIRFSGLTSINGEYTAGHDEDIPAEVPTYEANTSGNWSNKSIWTPIGTAPACPDGGPNGAIVIINSQVTLDQNHRFAYKTFINGTLKVSKTTYGHNLGTIDGDGTLYLEDALMPAGRYSSFFDCSGNATLEFGGTGDYNIVADLFSSIPNLKLSGSGSRYYPDKDLTFCHSLVIDKAILDNSVNNRTLIINGTFERYNTGRFIAGTGSNATVCFSGDASQNIGGITGDFNGTSAFNNLEINNTNGLTTNGSAEVSGILLLTNGLINTNSSAPLVITNTSSSSVTPAGGTANSYVNGPLVKRMNQGDSFLFPVGNNDGLGNKLTLSATQTGTLDWTVKYVTPNNTYAQFATPLSYVNSKESWNVSANAGNEAIVKINWDANSDITPLVTENGLIDLRIASYNNGSSQWEAIASSASGNNSSGTISSSSRMTIPAAGNIDVTSATVNTVKPKAKLTPSGVLCGATAGIPVTFTSSEPIGFNYTLTYSIEGNIQSPVTVSALPFILPTTLAGNYELLSFTYNNGSETGVVDNTIITVYDSPTTANAGTDQSLCGANTATLSGNVPTIGAGLWSIVTGNGGTIVNPTSPTSEFNGVNGEGYTLRWTISNGECESSADISVAFPLLAAQPGAFTSYDATVCQGETGVEYTVPLDATVASYSWSYSGSGVNINGSGNSVDLDFTDIATNGTLSVTATNNCNTSAPRTIDVTVNETTTASIGSDIGSNFLCVNNSVTFTATPGSGPAVVNYEFFVDNISQQTGTSGTYTATNMVNNQVVNVVATTALGCKSSSNDITVAVLATENLWIGAANGSWNNPANWCSGNVPATNDNIVISSKTVNQPIIEDVMIINNLHIESGTSVLLDGGAKLTIDGNFVNDGELILENKTGINGMASFIDNGTISGSGEARIKLTLPSTEWHYVSSPVAAAVLGNFNTGESGASVYVYRNKKWYSTGVTHTATALLNLEGVLVKYSAEKTLNYTGTLNSGSNSFSRTYDAYGWNLFGNPYPCFIDWQDDAGTGWNRPNIVQTMWYRTRIASEMAFVTYNRTAPQGARAAIFPTGTLYSNEAETELALIPPMQAVWVRANSATTISVNKEARSHGNSGSYLKSGSTGSSADIIRVVSANEQSRDGAVIYFWSNSTEEMDQSDSEKRFNDSEVVPEVYTLINTTPAAINGLSQLDDNGRTIPLSVRNRISDEVTLNFDLGLFNSGHSVELEDKQTGELVNLRATPNYTYTPSVLGEVHDRFVIHISYSTTSVVNPGEDVESGDSNGITIVGMRGKAMVEIASELLETEDALIEVYSLNGQKVTETTSATYTTLISLPRVDAAFVIKVTAGGKMKTEKVLGKL